MVRLTFIAFIIFVLIGISLLTSGCQSTGTDWRQDMFVQGQPTTFLANQDVDIPVVGGNVASHPYIVRWTGEGSTVWITELIGPDEHPSWVDPVLGNVFLYQLHIDRDWQRIARDHRDGRVRRSYPGQIGDDIWRLWIVERAYLKYPYAKIYERTGRNSNTYGDAIGSHAKARGVPLTDWDLGHSAIGE